MNLDAKLEQLSNRTASVIGRDECRKFAVCIPLIKAENGYDVLFQVRSTKIDRQPGDICFPGGMLEEGETFLEAALRELSEELLFDPANVTLLGESDSFLGSFIDVHVYVVELKDYQGTYSEDEVAEVFRVPLDFFINTKPDVYRVPYTLNLPDDFPYDKIYGGRDYQWSKRGDTVLFYQFEDRTIWGMTAKMVTAFSALLK